LKLGGIELGTNAKQSVVFGFGAPAIAPSNVPARQNNKSIPPVSTNARPRARHFGLAIWFFLAVVMPSTISAYYLEAIAADQFASTVGFSVRRAENAPPAP